MSTCPHDPVCPPADAPDAAAARIVAEHLQECGYALLCNGRVLMEHGGLLPVPRREDGRVAGPVTGRATPAPSLS